MAKHMATCLQCHRSETFGAKGIKPISVNKQGLCPVCVEVNAEIAFDERERKAAAALLGRRGGSVTSKAKAAAARENGKKGGRKKKVKR